MNARKEQRYKEALIRNEKWAALSFQQQLDSLDKTFGVDLGAAKQRAKIKLKMLKQVDPVPETTSETKPKRKRTRKKKK